MYECLSSRESCGPMEWTDPCKQCPQHSNTIAATVMTDVLFSLGSWVVLLCNWLAPVWYWYSDQHCHCVSAALFFCLVLFLLSDETNSTFYSRTTPLNSSIFMFVGHGCEVNEHLIPIIGGIYPVTGFQKKSFKVHSKDRIGVQVFNIILFLVLVQSSYKQMGTHTSNNYLLIVHIKC